MAGERCNLGKDEAELLKPSSPSSPNPAQSAPQNPPSLFLNPPQEFLSQLTEKSEPNNPQISQLPEKSIPKSIKTDSPKETAPISPESIKAESPKEIAPISPESTKPSIGSIKLINRCSICAKRVGLTGFRCRCGDLFCGSHRYSDSHDCSFDYKAAGRAEILKNNPVVRAAKIIKI